MPSARLSAALTTLSRSRDNAVTGNVLTAAQAAVAGDWLLFFERMGMVGSYLVGVLVFEVLDWLLGKRTSAAAASPVTMIFCALPDLLVLLSPYLSGGVEVGAEPLYHAYFLALSMGTVNAIMVDDGFCTFAVTVGLQKVTKAAADQVLLPGGLSAAQKKTTANLAWILGSFGVGVIAAAVFARYLPVAETCGVLIGVAPLFGFLMWAHDVAHADELEAKRAARLGKEKKAWKHSLAATNTSGRLSGLIKNFEAGQPNKTPLL